MAGRASTDTIKQPSPQGSSPRTAFAKLLVAIGRPYLHWADIAAAICVAVLAAVLAGRRLAGGLTNPPSILTIVALAGVLIAISLATHWLSDRLRRLAQNKGRQEAHLLMLAALLVIALALWLPGVGWPAAGLVCVPFLVHLGFVARNQGLKHALEVEQLGPLPPPTEASQSVPAAESAGEVELQPTAADVQASQDAVEVLQEWTRTRDAQGKILLSGSVLIEIASLQRVNWEHVAFCPPFDVPPQVSFTQTSGPPCRLKVGQLLPQGMRIEARRSSADPETSLVRVKFVVKGERPAAQPAKTAT